MFGHLPIGGVEVWFIAAGACDSVPEIIRDEDLRDPLKEFKGMDMRLNPGGKILAEGGLSEGVVTGPQGSHKDLGLCDDSGRRINEWHGLPGIIHKKLLSGPIFPTETGIKLFGPLTIETAELTILVPFGMLFFILMPEKL